jgi:hypothetical protein
VSAVKARQQPQVMQLPFGSMTKSNLPSARNCHAVLSVSVRRWCLRFESVFEITRGGFQAAVALAVK